MKDKCDEFKSGGWWLQAVRIWIAYTMTTPQLVEDNPEIGRV